MKWLSGFFAGKHKPPERAFRGSFHRKHFIWRQIIARRVRQEHRRALPAKNVQKEARNGFYPFCVPNGSDQFFYGSDMGIRFA